MNEMMIQEAVLDSIDYVDLETVFAECEVLSALADTYTKMIVIQEQSSTMSFDGFSIVQEGDANTGDDKKTDTKESFGSKLKALPRKILEGIKRVLLSIADFLQRNIARLTIRNMTVVSSDKAAMKALNKAGCKLQGVDKNEDGTTVYSIWWPTLDYDTITDVIESYEGTNRNELNYSNFGKLFKSVLEKSKTTKYSATPLDGASKCAKAMKKAAAMCDKQLKQLEGLIDSDKKEGTVDKGTVINAEHAKALQQAAKDASEAMKNITNGWALTMNAYKAYKESVHDTKLDEKVAKKTQKIWDKTQEKYRKEQSNDTGND